MLLNFNQPFYLCKISINWHIIRRRICYVDEGWHGGGEGLKHNGHHHYPSLSLSLIENNDKGVIQTLTQPTILMNSFTLVEALKKNWHFKVSLTAGV